ncbi:ABC-type sugar transport system substrate-binding protein [Sinorhizobium meliloti]
MKTSFVAAVLAAALAGTASAETIGVSMQSFDNNFQTLLREGLDARASKVSGVNLQIEELRQTFPNSAARWTTSSPRGWTQLS